LWMTKILSGKTCELSANRNLGNMILFFEIKMFAQHLLHNQKYNILVDMNTF